MVSTRLFASVLLASQILLLYWTTPSAQSYHPTSISAPNSDVKELPYFTREKVKETFEVIKESVTVLTDTLVAKDVLKNFAKFASLAPGGIGALFSLVNVVLAFLPQEDPVMEELKEGFAEVNRKLDSLSIQISNLATDVEWFNYASVYSQDEVCILNAWRKFSEFRENSALVQNEEDKLRLVEVFTNYYEYTGSEASVANLYHYLTVNSTSLSRNLNQLLMKKFKCDVSEIGKYNFYFSSLLLKGIVLNEFYWRLIGLNQTNKEAEHTQMFKNIYRAQLSAVEFCLNNYEQYMKEDVMEISKALSPDNKQAIAAKVKEALNKKYNWYTWVVLVYNTDEDEHHIVYGMTKIPVGKITVAVGYTLTAWKAHSQDVKDQADTCFKNRQCEAAWKYIPECLGLWINLQLTDYVRVIYVTCGEDFAAVPKAFHHVPCSWDCSTSQMFLHYSRSLSVCGFPNPCQNGGQCRRLLDSNEGLCECPDGYYGDSCEKRMNISEAYIDHSVPRIPTKLKMMESKLEKKLEEILNTINERCPGP